MVPDVCPNCGAQLPRRARACPHCGSDEQTGWSDEAHLGGLGLPDEDFNYDEYVKREFGPPSNTPYGIKPFWRWVGILIIIFIACGIAGAIIRSIR